MKATVPAREAEEKSSVLTVIIAFCANALVAVAKSVAAALTGSASMTAEAAHSWADTGNQIFLLVAERRSNKPRDARHPLGYGREAYVWSMFAAFGLFTAGAVVSVWHGIQVLANPEPASDFIVAYLVLALAFVLEGVSFVQALRQARKGARHYRRHTLEHVVISSNPTLRAVFAEDFAALIGIAIAASGVALHQITGSAVPDAIGSILVGLLLGTIAVVLIDRNRKFLVGEPATGEARTAVVDLLLQHPEVDRVTYLHMEFVGPSRLYVVAAVDMVGDLPEHHVAVALRRVERALEDHDLIEEAVLTLATPGEQPLLGD
jgi:cation diffusion facilitator family transporter